jgi:delta8-fatty-acid desaturase
VKGTLAKTLQIISREEALRHNTLQDCWIIVYNKVYDITTFLQKHPGGFDVLLSRAGEDATSFFHAKHGNQERIKKMLTPFIIGELPAHQQIPEAVFDEPFIQELLEKISEAKLHAISPETEHRFYLLRTAATGSFFLLSLLALYWVDQKWLAALMVFFQAIIGTSLFGLIAHEATHRKYPYQPVLRKVLKLVWPIFWPFISQKPLYYEHNSHHYKIGDPEFDFEVAGFSKFIRYSGLVSHQPLHRFQHRIALFLYPFYANIITTYGGALSSFWSSHNRNVSIQHGLSLLASLTYYIILPSLIIGQWWWFVILYFVYQCTLYYGIYVGAAINHFTTQATVVVPKEQSNLYGYYICSNTTNFRTFHPFWFWYTGGFNVQIEHHLVPYVPVENLHKLVPIVKALCKKHGYPYVEFKSFRSLWNDHYAYLQELSKSQDSAAVLAEISNKQRYQPR